MGELSEALQTPPEMAGVLMLGALGAIFQNRYTVEVRRNWLEPLCMYTLVVAAAGEKKSAVIKAITAPFTKYEQERRKQENTQVVERNAEREALEQKKRTMQQKYASGKEGYTVEDVQAVAVEMEGLPPVYPYRLFVDDVTQEKLTMIMSEQGGSIAVKSSEGGIFDAMCGRYDSGLAVDVYLKAHSGDPLTVDRVHCESLFIDSPRMSTMLTVQPVILEGLVNDQAFRGRGLHARFLYAVCDSRIGKRKIDPPPVTQTLLDAYSGYITAMLEGTDRGTLTLSAEADKLYIAFAERTELRLVEDWEGFQDWGNKHTGAMIRIAGVFHAAKCAQNKTPASTTAIDGETMQRAILMADYLGGQAEKAFQAMGGQVMTEDVRYMLERIRSLNKTRITRRDLLRTCRRFRTVEDMNNVLNEF